MQIELIFIWMVVCQVSLWWRLEATSKWANKARKMIFYSLENSGLKFRGVSSMRNLKFTCASWLCPFIVNLSCVVHCIQCNQTKYKPKVIQKEHSPNQLRSCCILLEWELGRGVNIYSCFEKGCLTIGEKLSRQCRKLLWVIVFFFTVAWLNL